jgi:8-oxo-dGTP pyrophosphatase MutT (NUDIX family)
MTNDSMYVANENGPNPFLVDSSAIRLVTLVDEMSIRTISSREVYRNPWTSVREDVIERSNGNRGIYGVIDKDPATIIIPLERTAEGDFLYLVQQFRYTVQATFKEFPQGGWEMAEVVPEELARGELREETGLSAGRMTRLADLWIAYGVMRQKHHVFLAEDLQMGQTDRDPEEHDLSVHRVRVEEFEEMLLDGRVMDNCTAAAWGLYKVWRERRG